MEQTGELGARARLAITARAARLINSWLVTPMGSVDVTSRYRFWAAGLSTVVMPERRMSACVPSVKGFARGRRDARVGVEVADDRRLDVLVRPLALVCLAAVGHRMVAVPHLDGLIGLRVLAAMRAKRLVVVAGQREAES